MYLLNCVLYEKIHLNNTVIKIKAKIQLKFDFK